MSRHITSEKVLKERVIKMLPKGIPAEAVSDVECDPVDGGECGNDPSYWVYLAHGYQADPGCHVIHEDTLKDLKVMMDLVKPWPDDPAFEY